MSNAFAIHCCKRSPRRTIPESLNIKPYLPAEYRTVIISRFLRITKERNGMSTQRPKKRRKMNHQLLVRSSSHLSFNLTVVSEAESRRKTYSHNKVRTSLQDRTLDSMFPIVNPSQIEGSSSRTAASVLSTGMTKAREIKESECILTSVQNLRHSVVKGKHRRSCLLVFGL